MKIELRDYSSTPTPFAMPTQIRRVLPAVALFFFGLVFFWSPYKETAANYLVKNHHPRFPQKIWQLWKVDPLGFEEQDLNRARSWLGKNPDYRYEVLTDRNDMAWVEREFGPDGLNRLDIVYLYRELNAKIIKADILRYLVMYVEGGIYADIDVEALRPIGRFLPERFQERDVDMIIGVEIDQPEFHNHTILGSKCMSFCQWTFMCKPGLPVMLQLVENIIAWLKGVADEQRVGIADIKLDFDQVISGTGPSAFTKAILADMTHRIGRTVTWEPFHALTESKLIGGVLVLPVEAFAAGQGHSDSGNHDTKYSLVRHHYHASHWPEAHPRYKVEDCNWKPDCVEKWDKDRAEFDLLSKEEQDMKIAVKELKDKEDREKKEKEDKVREAKEKEEKEKKEKEEKETKAREERERERAEKDKGRS